MATPSKLFPKDIFRGASAGAALSAGVGGTSVQNSRLLKKNNDERKTENVFRYSIQKSAQVYLEIF